MSGHGIPRVSAAEPQSEQARIRQLQRIKDYKELVETVNTKVGIEKDYSPATLALTSKLLGLNPEYYTIWNHRRRILSSQISAAPSSQSSSSSASSAQDSITTLLGTDLAFLIPLLLKFPKCYWIWNHRAWLLQEAERRLPRDVARGFWAEELGLVSKMLARDSRNFHGWGYRRTVVSALERLGGGGDEDESEAGEAAGTGNGPTMRVTASLTQSEFDYTTRMIGTNLSNFSAWHTRSKLIPRLLDERGAGAAERQKMLDDELTLILEALYTDPYDASIWHYHAFLMSTLTVPPQPLPDSSEPTSASGTAAPGSATSTTTSPTTATSAASNPPPPPPPPPHQPKPATTVTSLPASAATATRASSPSRSPSALPLPQIAPSLPRSERVAYLRAEYAKLQELLEDARDCKAVYRTLLELAEAGAVGTAVGKGDKDVLRGYMDELEKLDPLRRARWAERRERMGL